MVLILKKRGTHMSRAAVVDLSRALRVFLRGSPVFLPP